MLFKSTIIAALVAVAAAIDPTTQWATDNPTSKPALGENVQAGTPYEVKWQATTPNKLSIWLYKGPSNNVLPQFVLVASVPNTGSAIVTIPKTVANSAGAGYGLQLRDDVTGQYQWTPQFGVVGAGETTVSTSAASSSAVSSTTQGGYQTGAPPTSKVHSSSSTKNATYSYTATVSASTFGTVTTGYPTTNGTLSVSRPTLQSTTTRPAASTTSGPAQSTGAAGILKAGAALAAGVAGLVAALV